MSGSPRSGLTWKEVADALRVSEISGSAILWREFKRQRKGRIGAKRTPLDTKATNDAQLTSDQAQLVGVALLAKFRARSVATGARQLVPSFQIEAMRDNSPNCARRREIRSVTEST